MTTTSTEARLLGLTPRQYTRVMEQAKLDAQRLRREAVLDAGDRALAWLHRAVASLRPRRKVQGSVVA